MAAALQDSRARIEQLALNLNVSCNGARGELLARA
jgi:hypothetical protein